MIVSGKWQANQSLQAYIPCDNLNEANEILGMLKQNYVEKYLLSFSMEGTMNWAQVGKIKKLLKVVD
jgi:hypothetical protein